MSANPVSKFAVDDLVKQILSTFQVSGSEADELAQGILSLVEAHSGDPSKLDHFSKIVQTYGDQLSWRSEKQRLAWLDRKQQAVDGYHAFLDRQRNSPFKKW